MKLSTTTNENNINFEFSIETLESQREDFEAELACLLTKVENLSQIDERTFENAGSDRLAWSNSFSSAAYGVCNRIDRLRRSILDGLYFGMLRSLSTADASALNYDLLFRHVVILSQSLTSAVASLLHELWMNDGDRLSQTTTTWSKCGVLFVVHSYMSCYQNENSMIEDTIESMRLLREQCSFRLAKSFTQVKNCATPLIDGEFGHLKITLPVPNRVWSRLPESLRRGEWFYLVPIYFNVGINHEQTLASKLGGIGLETEVNEMAYKTLRGYVKRLANNNNDNNDNNKELETICEQARRILDQLCTSLCTNETKNINLLTLSTRLCRLLNGILFLCCKSGKDRTSMGVTLEEVFILQRDYQLPETHFQSSLDLIRREGTRLENTLKNIGERQYAFSSLQIPFLPDLYRPPKGTHRKIQT